MDYSKVLIIIPTYNEAKNVAKLIGDLNKLYSGLHILVVDDTSPDGTYKVVQALSSDTIHLLLKKGKEGLGRAYVSGFNWALAQNKFETVISMDCDFSHAPAQVIDLLNESKSNEVVVGSRYVNSRVRIVNWPMKRLILSKLAAWYSRFWTWLPVTDPTAGFNCYDINYLKRLNLNTIRSNGYCFQVEMKFKLFKLGAKLKEVPITFVERENGKSKLSKKIVYEAIIQIPLLRLKSLFS
jgi:dolichol-phosphate mannosyltransferase